ncbi:cytochrome b5 domain-containing protein [Saccharospirillum salsuginis]|uniref:Cytochrome b5 heme-binding domain-containing protein n=1 Tax=Saccharospirillum salsuginis TaxID=418750 RepID=A0A918K169_9GAMM|nr:cytochrome b5 domain-containing protein [Saccharospirillum salsuginis]GGX40413.1 hypothetical protein GCM10007392_03910 [Saccharospirillum salsuginis]
MNQIAYTLFIAFVSSVLTLAGVVWLSPGQAMAETTPNTVSLQELASHDSADSCWKAIDGRVYDITDYINFHPTDPEVVTEWCGKVATDAWYDKGNGRAHSARATAMLAEYYVGVLEGAQVSGPLEAVEPEPASKPALPSTGEYKDGSYYAESEPSSRGWISMVEISVMNGRIIAVYYDEIQRDEEGNVTTRKSADMNYAQRWRGVSGGVTQLTAFPAYARQLVNTGVPEGVDALSGATGAYDGFQAVVRDALSQATP